MHATQEQLRDAKVDLAYRDFCAHLLIPLNECRKANYFLPWRCEHERHIYEKCQYKECVPADPRPVPFPSLEISPPRMRASLHRHTRSTTTRRSSRPPPRHLPRYMMRVAQQKAASGAEH